MKNIKLVKPLISKKDFSVMIKSLKSGWLTHGKNNKIFENKFSNLIGVNHSISMNSCTSALECALKVIEKKGEVIIPSFTWVSTANAVINTGNKPVFADVNINSRNISAKEIEKLITKKTIAVIVVHFGGMPCDMGSILRIVKKNKIELIEDSAETLGSTWKKKYTGSFGVGCFSFFPTKNITTTEGGMLTTNDKTKYLKIQKIIAHGIDKNLKKKFWHRVATLPGHNFRMPNHLAALGINQLKQLSKFNKKRNLIAKKYNKFLKEFSDIFEIQTLSNDTTHSYQMYTFLVKKNMRDNLLRFLNKNKIEASAHFDPPLHQQKYLKKYYKTKLKNTDILSSQIITLPIYPLLKNSEINYIIKIIKKWYSYNYEKK